MIGVLVAAAMAASFFVPWFGFFGETLGPVNVLDGDIDLANLSWRAWAFLGSFALAALAVVVAILQKPAGLFMLLAGAIPYALIAEVALGAREQAVDLGLPLPQSGGDPMQVFETMREFIEIGLPAYFITAALLIVLGLVRLLRGQ